MADNQFPVAPRASNIEYAIRDVVVPALALEEQGHEILKLNIGDPIAYPGLPTPPHMVDAYVKALQDGKNGYSHSYGIHELRTAIALDENRKGWNAQPSDVYVCHGVTEALQILFASVLTEETRSSPLALITHRTWLIRRCTVHRPSNTSCNPIMDGKLICPTLNQKWIPLFVF